MAFLDEFGLNKLWQNIMTKLNNNVDKIYDHIDKTQSNWNAQEGEPGYILNKPEEITSDDALELLAECGIIDPVTTADNSILIDENENILLV